jgi:diacylglycerol kinase family enzyme
MIGVWTNRPYTRPDIEILPATECRCSPLETGNQKLETRIYAEADGELLGTLPVSFSMSNQTVNLLVPATAPSATAVL